MCFHKYVSYLKPCLQINELSADFAHFKSLLYRVRISPQLSPYVLRYGNFKSQHANKLLFETIPEGGERVNTGFH